jgi:hypothetical protein
MRNLNTRFVGRARTHDNLMTFDSHSMTCDAGGNMLGKRFQYPVTTFDGRTADSTGAFLVGELERLDQTLHEPLAAVTYGRDIDMREDVTIADEVSSFTLSTYGSQGGLGTGNTIGNGKAWIGKNTDQITGLGLDIAKIPHPLRPWGMELKYTILELESAAKLGRPVDQQKFAGLQLKHQMDIDEQVYYGDTTTGDTGLVNATLVTNVTNVASGAQSTPAWTTKTPAEILQDFNEIITSAWAASAWAVMPTRVLLPPSQFGYISTQLVSAAGTVSILKYVQENNLLATSGRGKLDIFPCKWLIGAGAGGTIGTESGPSTGTTYDRMVAYTKEKERVRYPMTLLQRTPVQYDSIYHKTTYFCRLGVVEVVYPETIAYRDGL